MSYKSWGCKESDTTEQLSTFLERGPPSSLSLLKGRALGGAQV